MYHIESHGNFLRLMPFGESRVSGAVPVESVRLPTMWPQFDSGPVWVWCWFSSCSKGFFPGSPAPQNPTSPNSISTRTEDQHEASVDVASSLNMIFYLFVYLPSLWSSGKRFVIPFRKAIDTPTVSDMKEKKSSWFHGYKSKPGRTHKNLVDKVGKFVLLLTIVISVSDSWTW